MMFGIISLIFCSIVFVVLFYFVIITRQDDPLGYGERRCKVEKNENIGSLVIPVGPGMGERAFKEATRELNNRIKLRLDDKIDMIKTITTAIGQDGTCYITVWYASKGCFHSKPERKIEEGFKI